jgi:heme exporter protein A
MLQMMTEDLSRDFGERKVLTRLTETFSGGDRILVRGPNGSGKTTLLKILAGVLAPSQGSVWVGEGDREWAPGERRHRTGYLAPDLVLYEEFTALENLTFFGRVRGLPRDPGRDLALLDRLGIADRAHDPVGTLSTGLRQRVKMSFALQAGPRVLLLDEPGSNLDQVGRDLVTEVVNEFTRSESIVFVATNDPSEFGLGTRAVELG